jgi:hypothetical protein
MFNLIEIATSLGELGMSGAPRNDRSKWVRVRVYLSLSAAARAFRIWH